MTETDKSSFCECVNPTPGGENGSTCENCNRVIGRSIIDGEAHAGYTSLGNGQAFFEKNENWSLGSGHSGVISKDNGYFVTFGDAEVVCPHNHRDAQLLGTDWVSIDHLVHPDGDVTVRVAGIELSELPDGE